MSKRSYTDEQLKAAVASNVSISGTLRSLGLTNYGGNHYSLKKYIEKLKLNTDHFLGIGHNLGKNLIRSRKRGIEEYLKLDGHPISSSNLKSRLIRENLIINKCNICEITSWLDKKLSLHLDHINGNKGDNRLENLRLLCPNCHSQTDTYCRAKSAFSDLSELRLQFPNLDLRISKPTLKTKRCECGRSIRKKSIHCIDCYHKHRKGTVTTPKIKWPDLQDLIQMLKESNYLQLSKKLGVSDNAIRKYIYRRGINPKSLLPYTINY